MSNTGDDRVSRRAFLHNSLAAASGILLYKGLPNADPIAPLELLQQEETEAASKRTIVVDEILSKSRNGLKIISNKQDDKAGIELRTGGRSADNTRLRITSDGRVGIGTKTPGAAPVDQMYPLLDVAGYASIMGLRLGLDGVNDILSEAQPGLTLTAKGDDDPDNQVWYGGIKFRTGDSKTVRMRITPDGGLIGGGASDEHASIWIVGPPSDKEDPFEAAADNRTRIQRAIDSVASRSGGTVILQNGEYLIDRATSQLGSKEDFGILMRHGVRLEGVSMNGTVLIPVEAGEGASRLFDLIRMELPQAPTGVQVAISDLRIANTRASDDGSWPLPFITAIAIANYHDSWSEGFHDPQPALVENVWIQRCEKGVLVSSWFSELHNCIINHCKVGIDLSYVNRTPPAGGA